MGPLRKRITNVGLINERPKEPDLAAQLPVVILIGFQFFYEVPKIAQQQARQAELMASGEMDLGSSGLERSVRRSPL